jgi:hypothetical protein
MKTLTIVCLFLSLVITAYCFFESQLPHAQYAKVLSDLKTAGIKDQELIERVRWSIVGVQTTWLPLIVATLFQNVLILIVLAKLATAHRVESSK